MPPRRAEPPVRAGVPLVSFSMAIVNRNRLGEVLEQLRADPGRISNPTLNEALAAVLDHWFATHPKEAGNDRT